MMIRIKSDKATAFVDNKIGQIWVQIALGDGG
jgi:hypothetical protein